MTDVTKITWRIKTGASWWGGTNTKLKTEIWRDGQMLKRLNVEPGNTSRLDRATDVTYYWEFENPATSACPIPASRRRTPSSLRTVSKGI